MYVDALIVLWLCTVYRAIKTSVCTWRLQYKKHAKIPYFKQFYHRIHSECGPCYTEHGLSRTQFGVSINVWRLAGETLNITCNFLYLSSGAQRLFDHPVLSLLKLRCLECDEVCFHTAPRSNELYVFCTVHCGTIM